MNQISHQAEPGKILAVRISLDTAGLAHKQFPAGDFDCLADAQAFADSTNAGKGPEAKDCDVVRLYDDQGQWVGGHSSLPASSRVAEEILP